MGQGLVTCGARVSDMWCKVRQGLVTCWARVSDVWSKGY